MLYETIYNLVNGTDNNIVIASSVLLVVFLVVNYEIIVNSIFDLFRLKERR